MDESQKENMISVRSALNRLEKDLWTAYSLLPELIQRVNEAQLDVQRVMLETEHKC